MSAVYPLILGVVTKVYDDIMDAGFEVPANVVSIIQSFIIQLFHPLELFQFFGREHIVSSRNFLVVLFMKTHGWLGGIMALATKKIH